MHPDQAWHQLTADETIIKLNSAYEGLSAHESETRLKKEGYNVIRRAKAPSALTILIRQIRNPLIYVLLVAGIFAIVMGKITDGIVVLSVVLINALVGFFQEIQASKAIQALNNILPQHATVLRDGKSRLINVTHVVPGDIILLQQGDLVPADMRLMEVNNLQIEEAMLTGESLPSSKSSASVDRSTELGDRTSMAFGGTLVTSGTGKGIVTATGAHTELGKISELLEQTSSLQTPLTKRLTHLARGITVGIVSVAVMIFIIGLVRDYSLVNSALAAITLAVASIPEGLPAVVTIASAIGVRRMANRRAIIRHLPAVETLGSTTIICTDKTGTLTNNEMTVEALWDKAGIGYFTGTGYEPVGECISKDEHIPIDRTKTLDLLQTAILCNDARLENKNTKWRIIGDPTEGALVVAARKIGQIEDELRQAYPRIDEIPFDSEKMFMATLHLTPNNRKIICVKGSPEVIVKLCSANNTVSSEHEKALSIAKSFAETGMRVLAFASAYIESEEPFSNQQWQEQLVLLGLLGMIDPPRDEAIEAVLACQQAGIKVKMVTGDHPSTAFAIGRIFNLENTDSGIKSAITGRQIDEMSDSQLRDVVDKTNVFARVAPEHKLRIVKILQEMGHVVAMTGDGVNDAPALKRADIGVAMGQSGTAVAKEASDMVLANDNFASIEAAVEEGRRVYSNLMKSLAFILPTSLGQALVILVAVLFFPIVSGSLLMPIEPVQILWVNLVVAVALALPLAFEAREPDLMSRPPRSPDEPILSPFMIFRTFFVGSLMTISAVGLFLYEYYSDLEKNIPFETALAESQTVAVTTIILFQCIYLFSCRSLTQSVTKIGLFSNKYIYAGVALTLILQVVFIYSEFMNTIFNTHPLSIRDWVAPVLMSIIWIPFLSLEKRYWRSRLNKF